MPKFPDSKMIRFRGFKLHYVDAAAMESMCREAEAFESFFTPRTSDALIIDCGSNIGVTMLEWKSRWPQAKIICIEPDPFAFALLEKTVEINDLPSVRLIQAAISDTDGPATFYGDISASADARGNSLEASWAKRPGTVERQVQCRRLSSIIGDNHVDFLKLDVEGSEQRVVQEIASRLHQIDAIYIEVHETQNTLADNSVAAVCDQLTAAGFRIDALPRHEDFALPAHLAQWQATARPSQTQLLCWR